MGHVARMGQRRNRHTLLFESKNKPCTGLYRVPGGRGSKIYRQSTNEGGKVVSPTHRPPLPPGNAPDTDFC